MFFASKKKSIKIHGPSISFSYFVQPDQFYAYRECLVGCVQYADDSTVKCPHRDADYSCSNNLQEREIKAVSRQLSERLN